MYILCVFKTVNEVKFYIKRIVTEKINSWKVMELSIEFNSRMKGQENRSTKKIEF